MGADRFSELRILRWHDRISGIVEDGIGFGPIRIGLDLTNLCNDNCPWCEPLQYREHTIKDRKHTLSTEVAREVLKDAADMDCKTVNFSGGGEPLLHHDFGVLLRYSRQLGMRSWVVTNGFFIDIWLGVLLGADHVRVSLDASNEDEYGEMHGVKGSEFERVCRNTTELAKARIAARSPEIGISYLVADCNRHTDSIRRIFEFAKNAGVDFIQFRPVSGESSLTKFSGEWLPLAKAIEDIAREYPSVECFPLGKRWKDVFLQREFKKCYAAFTTAVIGANGDVQVCCDRRDISYGNVYEQSFKEIWHSGKHRQAANDIVPAFCDRCLMCGYNRAVEKYVIGNDALPELV